MVALSLRAAVLASARPLALAALSLALAAGPCRSADLEIYREQARRDAEAKALTGTPQVITCSVEPGVYSRPELAEFWTLVKTAGDEGTAKARVLNRFGPPPWIFDGCLEPSREKHRVVIHTAQRAPADADLMIQRVRFLVETTAPAAWYQRRWITVEMGR